MPADSLIDKALGILPIRAERNLGTGLWRPTLVDENGKPLAGFGLLAKPTLGNRPLTSCFLYRRREVWAPSRRADEGRDCRAAEIQRIAEMLRAGLT
jgi:hypothetical protein